MCIGVPMRIESVDGMVAVATSDADGNATERHRLDMLIVGPQPPGTWVLAFHGAARRVLDEAEARQILDALSALAIALDADGEPDARQGAALDALFADLVERAPQLPEHLRRH
jgi:hydrogenase expression/formation protein HypC